MPLFSTRKPRKFNRISIYTDERREKLDKLVREVKREQGELPPDEKHDFDYTGKFSKFTPHAQKASTRGFRITLPIAIIAILLLLFVWHYIITGKLTF